MSKNKRKPDSTPAPPSQDTEHVSLVHRIFFDTTALHQSWPSVSAKVENVLTACRKLGIGVEIPEPVMMELERNWFKNATKTLQTTATSIKELWTFVGEPSRPGTQLPDLNALQEAYTRYVENTMRQWKIEVTPTSSALLADVLRHAVKEELVFEEKGRNFKDAVILLSVVERMKAQAEKSAAILISNDSIFAKRESELLRYCTPLGVELHCWTLEDAEPRLRNMLGEIVKARVIRHQLLAYAALLDALPEIQGVLNESRDWHNANLRSTYMYGGEALSNIQLNAVAEVNVAVLDHEPQAGEEVRISAYLTGSGVYTRFDASTGGMSPVRQEPITVGVAARGVFDGNAYKLLPGMNFSY